MPPTAEEQLKFLMNVQRLLAEGQFTLLDGRQNMCNVGHTITHTEKQEVVTRNGQHKNRCTSGHQLSVDSVKSSKQEGASTGHHFDRGSHSVQIGHSRRPNYKQICYNRFIEKV